MLKTFHPLDWAAITKDFAIAVCDKTYSKMPYKLWRELDSVITDYDVSNVRVGWDTRAGCSSITVCFDLANGTTLPPYCFDAKDNSFGSYLYETNLFKEESRNMKVKNYYSDNYLRYSNSNAPLTYLYDTADVEIEATIATKASISDLNKIEDKVDTLAAEVAATTPMKNTINNNNKENNAMKFNFDFGPVNGSMVRMSLYGLAVKNKAGTWVSYDAKVGDIMDVDILNFDGAKFLYKMPVATKDIAIGDVVIHNGIPMFVIAIAVNGAYITAVDPINGERKDIMLPKSPFGFNFATKVVNLLGNLNTGADASNPFGNLGLMLMLNDNKDMGDLLPLMMMTGNTGAFDMSNPLMLYALMGKDSKSSDNILPLMLMMNATTPAHTCACGGHCGENHTHA